MSLSRNTLVPGLAARGKWVTIGVFHPESRSGARFALHGEDQKFGKITLPCAPIRCYRSETYPNCRLRHVRDYLRPKGDMFCCTTNLEHHSLLLKYSTKNVIFSCFLVFFINKGEHAALQNRPLATKPVLSVS